MTISPSYPVILQNGTTADATQVMADFLQIQNDVNTNAAHNGANSDITSLSGLTSPIPITGGGTGGTSAGAARTALGIGAAGVENLGGFIIDDGAGNLTLSASTVLPNGTVATTQTSTDNTTKPATDQFVQTLIATRFKTIKAQRFLAAGAFTYTPSAGMIAVIIRGCGAGAGGAGANTNQGGTGAGAGTYIEVAATAAQIGASQAGVIGTAGTGGAGSGPANGTDGTATTLGTLLSIPGGTHGSVVSTVSGGDVNMVPGGAGGGNPTITGGLQVIRTKLGQQGGPAGTMTTSTGGFQLGGYGGSTPMGDGGPWNIAGGSTTPTYAGTNGLGNGSGGGGAVTISPPQNGGNGTDGGLEFIEFCNQ